MAESKPSFELARLREHIETLQPVVEAYERGLDDNRSDAPKPIEIGPRIAPSARPRDLTLGTWDTAQPSYWSAVPWPQERLNPSPGFGAATLGGFLTTTTMVLVFGLREGALAKAVALVAKLQRRLRTFRPVFITDSASHRVFAKQGFVSEYLPGAVYRDDSGSLNWNRIDARLHLIETKWAVAATMDLSAPADVRKKGEVVRSAETSGRSERGATTPGDIDRARAKNAGGREAALASPEVALQAKLIRESGLFDEEWYLKQHPDLAASGVDPIVHYLEVGAPAGSDPHPLFQTMFYARQMMRRKRDRTP